MEFRKILALRGPNIWVNFTVLEAWVELQELADFRSLEIPGFGQRLLSWLPNLGKHHALIGEPGTFAEMLERGVNLAAVLEHVALELERLCGSPVSYSRTRDTGEAGVYRVIIEYKEEAVGKACL